MSTDTTVYTLIKKSPASFVKNSDSVCIGLKSIDLTAHYGVHPTNGIWKGVNLNNSIFDLVASGVGDRNHYYIIQNSYGCLDTSYYQTRVDDNSLHGILDTSDFKVCEASGPIHLNQFKTLVSKGSWKGTSIIDSLFYPTSSGVGNFVVRYISQNKSCLLELNKKIWVVARPSVPELIGAQSYCTNSLFSVSIKNPDPTLVYKWSYGTNSYTGTNLVGTLTEDLAIGVVSTNYLNCESFKSEYSLSLDEPSAVIRTDRDIVENGEEILFGLSNPVRIASAKWNFGDGAELFDSMSIARIFYNPSIVAAKDYLVECEIKSETGCVSKLKRTITVVKRTSSGIDNVIDTIIRGGKPIVSLFPNPARDYVDIVREGDLSSMENSSVVLFDFTGRLIYSTDMKQSLRIDLSGFPAGVYFVRVGEGEGVKLEVER